MSALAIHARNVPSKIGSQSCNRVIVIGISHFSKADVQMFLSVLAVDELVAAYFFQFMDCHAFLVLSYKASVDRIRRFVYRTGP
jgi:hypothetical protein